MLDRPQISNGSNGSKDFGLCWSEACVRDLPTVQSLSESVRCGTCGTSTDHFIIANDDLISVTDDSSSPLMPDPPTPSYSYQGADVEWSDSALRYAACWYCMTLHGFDPSQLYLDRNPPVKFHCMEFHEIS